MGDPAASLRRRLAEIDVELRTLPDDALACKHELRSEADAIRRELANLVSDDLSEAKSQWAKRSARKGSHAEADSAEQAARIVSPIEGAGGVSA